MFRQTTGVTRGQPDLSAGQGIEVGCLIGARIPSLTLEWIRGGESVDIAGLGRDCGLVLYGFAGNETPGRFIVEDEQFESPDAHFAAGFRDTYIDLVSLEAAVVGISSRSAAELRRFAECANLSSLLLTDPCLGLAEALDVPTRHVDGTLVYDRFVLIAVRGQIRYVDYPIASQHACGAAEKALDWMTSNAFG